jgi:hypothetical protein
MKEIEAAAKDANLVIGLDPEALARMQPPKPLIELVEQLRRNRGLTS